MPSDRSGRWGDAAAAGALIAGGGALTLSHGVSMPKGAPLDPSTLEKPRAKAEARNAANQRKKLAGLNQMLDEDTRANQRKKPGQAPQYRVNAHMINNQRAAVQGADERHRLAAIEDVNRNARNSARHAAAGAQAARRRVMRLGSGALGAGASLAVLGGVMAERRRKQSPKPALAATAAEPRDVPLKDYRSMVHDGIPVNVSPSAGRDWLKANKDRA